MGVIGRWEERCTLLSRKVSLGLRQIKQQSCSDIETYLDQHFPVDTFIYFVFKNISKYFGWGKPCFLILVPILGT